MPPARRPARRVAILLRADPAAPLFLSRALASILAQDLPDWQLVIVADDGDRPDALDTLLSRHETGFGDRVSVHRVSGTPAPHVALGLALERARAGFRFPFVAVHEQNGAWDPAFLSRTIAALSAPAHRDRSAVLAAWVDVRERLSGGELVEEKREPVRLDPACAAIERAAVADLFPTGALLCRAELLDPAALGAAPPGRLPRALARTLLLHGDFVVLPEPLLFRHRRTDIGPEEPPGSNDGAAGDGSSRNAALRALLGREPAALELLALLSRQDDRAAARAEAAGADLARLLANVDRNGLWGHARHEDLQLRLIRVEETLVRVEARLDRLQPIEERLDHLGRAVLPVWRRAIRRIRRARRGRTD
ncbi:MAG: glycosyltransferase family 2 protein [Gluconacetobacter diazotrophicus]|nr:glycosyltransferase family 2 protein [Gluconacetobacter diazotrophicus]